MNRDNMIMTSSDTVHERYLNGLATELNEKFGERVVSIVSLPGHCKTKRIGEAKFIVWFEEYGNDNDTGVTWYLPESDYYTQRNILKMMVKLANNPTQDGKPLGWPANLKIR